MRAKCAEKYTRMTKTFMQPLQIRVLAIGPTHPRKDIRRNSGSSRQVLNMIRIHSNIFPYLNMCFFNFIPLRLIEHIYQR